MSSFGTLEFSKIEMLVLFPGLLSFDFIESTTLIYFYIIWQGKSKHSDWLFLGRDSTIRKVQAMYFVWFSKASKFICSLNY